MGDLQKDSLETDMDHGDAVDPKHGRKLYSTAESGGKWQGKENAALKDGGHDHGGHNPEEMRG